MLAQALRAPALHALLHQVLAFFVTVFLLALLESRGVPPPGAVATAFVQGVLAAGLSAWRRLAPWWLAIQLLFAPLLLAAQALQMPPLLFLFLFLVFLLLYWSAFRTQVPYYPSSAAVWRLVATLLPAGRPLRCVDIGSGFGGLVMHLAAGRQDGDFLGVELAPLPWAVSCLRARLRRSRARFLRADYMDLNLAEFDVVFAYLSPAAMPALWRKAHSEMRSGSLLLSLEFAVPGQVPDLALAAGGRAPALFGWRM